MNTWKRTWLLLLAAVVVVSLPVAGRLLRRGSPARCALDGIDIDPLYRVSVEDGAGRDHVFCCPHCARLWLKQQSDPPRSITVTDESTGEPIDSSSAWYARSR